MYFVFGTWRREDAVGCVDLLLVRVAFSFFVLFCGFVDEQGKKFFVLYFCINQRHLSRLNVNIDRSKTQLYGPLKVNRILVDVLSYLTSWLMI